MFATSILLIWELNLNPNSSVFHKTLCKGARMIRSQFWVKVCNPNIIDFWNDSWLFDIPLDRKPTYINMYLDLDSATISNFVFDNSINLNSIHDLVGDQIDNVRLLKMRFDDSKTNLWVWQARLLEWYTTFLRRIQIQVVIDWVGEKFES